MIPRLTTVEGAPSRNRPEDADRKSTRLNSSLLVISYAGFCLKNKNVTDALPFQWPRDLCGNVDTLRFRPVPRSRALAKPLGLAGHEPSPRNALLRPACLSAVA